MPSISDSWTIPSVTIPGAPSSTIVPVFPMTAGASDCDAVVYDQDHFLELFNRIFPFDYITPFKNFSNSGYENFQAAAKVGERLSLAVQRLECGALAIFAPVGAKATGTVELLRPDTTHGAVTVKAGTIVTTSRGGRDFVIKYDVEFGSGDIGPVVADVEAVAQGYEWNVPGKIVTESGEELWGEIDTVRRLYTDPVYGDPTIYVRQVTETSGGVSPMLEGLGADRGVFRKAGESADAFRFRVRSLPDTVSPGAVNRAVTAILADYGLDYDFIETFEQTYQECYDAPSPNAGTPTYRPTMPASPFDTNLFTYDDPRPEYPFNNVYMDEVEYRGTFIIVLERATLWDFGFAYDDPDSLSTDFRNPITGRQRGTPAYDIPATADPALVFPAAYDGYDIRTAAAAASLWETLREIKAAGIVVIIELRRD